MKNKNTINTDLKEKKIYVNTEIFQNILDIIENPPEASKQLKELMNNKTFKKR